MGARVIAANDALDAEVFAAIQRGETSFLGIRISVRDNATAELPADLYRPVDRSLQRLKKQGRIAFVRGRGWEVVR